MRIRNRLSCLQRVAVVGLALAVAAAIAWGYGYTLQDAFDWGQNEVSIVLGTGPPVEDWEIEEAYNRCLAHMGLLGLGAEMGLGSEMVENGWRLLPPHRQDEARADCSEYKDLVRRQNRQQR